MGASGRNFRGERVISMTPTARDYIDAARCPATMPTGEAGLWKLERVQVTDDMPMDAVRRLGPYSVLTILSRHTEATMHLARGDVVMEDSLAELHRHLPIWRHACGRVLVTGLGLGCVVRGLLANPAVERVTVIELDSHIIRWVWPEFMADRRLMLLQGNAFDYEFPPGTKFDFAWHDIYDEKKHEAVLHTNLMMRYHGICGAQGAWGMPRWWRRLGGDFIRGRS